jgi:hypothetical protein
MSPISASIIHLIVFLPMKVCALSLSFVDYNEQHYYASYNRGVAVDQDTNRSHIA